MIVRIITVTVKPDAVDAFQAATVRNHEKSIQEPGVLRFDVLRDNDRSELFYLYEAYADEQATVDHKTTEHYLRWKSEVADLMDGDRTSVACSVVAPDSTGW